MKFTIFTGFYNYIETIDELVNSILNQTHSDWEWIIWDDFSDNPEIKIKLDELVNLDNRIKRLSPEYKKQFYWNPPTYAAKGDICMVLDSDDMMLPKLLEVYEYNFKKFPDVQMISCNSELRNGDVNGNILSFRYIKYGNICNFKEALKENKTEYKIGDCRAWRNNIDNFTAQNWVYCAEDYVKTLKCEKLGKILFLPRTLCIFAVRNNSISKNLPDELNIENQNILDIDGFGNEELSSIEDFYDRRFEELVPLYFTNLNYSRDTNSIAYVSSSINPRVKEIINNLFFDHNIMYNQQVESDYIISKINDIGDIDMLGNYLDNCIPKKQLVISSDRELQPVIEEMLQSKGFSWFWFVLNKYHAVVNFS